jgi:hypothetical protein
MSSTKAKSKPVFSRIKKNYGLDEADYNNLLKRQRYQCAICGVDEKNLTKRLHVDHNHKTGIARGLLCVNCNLGLGSFKDNQEFLLYAVLYLQDHE